METDKPLELPAEERELEDAFEHWRKEYLDDWLPEYEDESEDY